MPRPKTPIVLTSEERSDLEQLVNRKKVAQQLALRARIVLACAEGVENKVIARRLHVSQQMVCRWRIRFARDRVDGLYDEPRPGAPRKVSDAMVEKVVDATLERKPRGATHWSTRSMAKQIGLSRSTVSRI